MIELRDVPRTACRLVVPLLFLALAGCGVWPLGRPTASPSPLPGDRLVFTTESGGGGFTHYLYQAFLTPGLAVYGDGRVIQYDGEQRPNVPAAYVINRVDPALVATFVAETEARDLITNNTDFGDPPVTDMPSTTVQLHGASGLYRIHVYAFREGFDDDLTGAQRRAREELAEVIDRAAALPGDAERSPYRPHRVRVTEFTYTGKGRGPEWPGPDPERFLVPAARRSIVLACGELAGQAAEKAYQAARNNPDGVWTYASKPRVFAVVPIVPGFEVCPG
jgi:hypothetical protein